jgi:hypothetical protein
MLAARNHRFRIAAVLGALSYLILAAGEIVEANRLFGLSGSPVGFEVSAVIYSAAHIVGACGWVMVATGLGAKLDWPRLRLGGTVVAVALIAYFVGVALETQAVIDFDYPEATNINLAFVVDALSALAFALGAVLVVFACADSRRGAVRARWLRAAAGAVVLASLASTVALLFQQAYWSSLRAQHAWVVAGEFTTGAIVAAVGSFAFAVGTGVFARHATAPLGRREGALVGAALILVFATVCVAGGEALIAYAYRDSLGAVETSHWLLAAARVVTAIAIVPLGLGARAVAKAEQVSV